MLRKRGFMWRVWEYSSVEEKRFQVVRVRSLVLVLNKTVYLLLIG